MLASRDRRGALAATTSGRRSEILTWGKRGEDAMTRDPDRETADLDLLRLYLDDIGRHPLLTKDDEVELSQAFEAGQAAQAELHDLPAGHPDRPRPRTEEGR